VSLYSPACGLTHEPQAQSYISSLLPALRSEFLSLATDTSYIARATSVLPELLRFGATATVNTHILPPSCHHDAYTRHQISLPAAATDLGAFELYTTVPPWYSALPSGVRSLYDDVGKSVEGFLKANEANATSARVTSTATVSATATLSGGAGTPVVTPSTVMSTTSLPEMGVVVAAVIGAMM
jgi:hypothetical protein